MGFDSGYRVTDLASRLTQEEVCATDRPCVILDLPRQTGVEIMYFLVGELRSQCTTTCREFN